MRYQLTFLLLTLLLACGQPKTEETKTKSIPKTDVLENSNAGEVNPIGIDSRIDLIQHAFIEKPMEAAPDKQAIIRKIFDESLTNGVSYDLLEYLCHHIGARISGSPQAASAVEFTYQVLDSMGIEKVWKQEVLVPRWIRGKKEQARVVNSVSMGSVDLPVTALGGSIATPKGGITASVIMVSNFEELALLSREKVKGKIVFFNAAMDGKHINTFEAYGSCVQHRWAGAVEAAKMGAVATIVRSLSSSDNDYPHTGSMGYEEGIDKIPAAAISTNAANLLQRLVQEQEDLKLHFDQSCYTMSDVISYNVVAEIRGSEYPDEIIDIGGHLDSWDIGEGAHDDGAGVVQSIEVLRIFRNLGIRPKRTIRAIMFMNEENGLKGGKKYADLAALENENHIAALETDRGGFAPRYFTVEGENYSIEKFKNWIPYLHDYGVYDFKEGGSGADISPLKSSGTVLFGLVPESQRYFEYHHSDLDRFEAVNKRELEMGAAALTALVFIISEEGVQ